MTLDLYTLGGLALAAVGVYWFSTSNKQQVEPQPKVDLKSGIQTRLDALVSLDALLSYFVSQSNQEGAEAVQKAIQAATQHDVASVQKYATMKAPITRPAQAESIVELSHGRAE